ncbi:MAG: hypothetical protein H6701_10570 [Myxococcales bacterium]|nr:hypothetical protein [Myxococcales bacterium]
MMPGPGPAPLTLAFFDLPWASRLATTLPIVRALVDRGHRVVAFTLEGLRAQVEAAGAEVVPQPPFTAPPPDCTVNLRAIDYAARAVPTLVEVLAARAPDAVIFTAKCLWAALAADVLGLPTIGIHTNALWPRAVPLPARVQAAGRVFGALPPAAVDALVARDRAAWDTLAARFAPRRIEAVDVVPPLANAMNLRGDHNLVYTAAALQPHREAFGPGYHFVGPCYDAPDDDPAFAATLEALPRPRVYAALGSIPAYSHRPALLAALTRALGGGERGVIVAAGEAVDAIGDPGPAVCLRRWVPQRLALAHADLFVSHAGTNSAYEALLAGVPLLMLPQGADQFIVAWHAERLGLGRWFDGPPEQIGAAVDALLADRALAERVRAAGAALRSAGGVTRAVAVIEAALGR